jgi:TolB protein
VKGVPLFDTGREEFTKSVKGSTDFWPQWDVDGEGLFFASDRSQGVSNIWYKRRDARGYTQLTFHNVAAWYPSISKDGNKVAYQVLNNENTAGWSIWIVGRDGRSATELGSGEMPKFSPDGKKIAFAQRDFNGVRQIWVMDINGGNRIQITNEFCVGCNGNQLPVWHPQGQRLVFVSDTKSQNNDIWMVELDGARMVQLTNYLGEDTTPEFTPDGRYLMFSSTRGGEVHHIWMGEFAAN